MAPDRLLASLRALEAGERLLEALPGLAGVHLVGGAVRDLALGRRPAELDLVAAADGPGVAGELARRLGGTVRVHEAFGTATVELDGESLDVVTARAEDYPHPGSLPVVRPGTLEEDLRRRDFSVNAIALGVSDDVRGAVAAVPGGPEDLAARRLRVLHDRSFEDDATRLVRLARYGPRLALVLDPRTEQLARSAFAAGAPPTVGASRWAGELWLLLGEERAVAGLALLADLADGPVPGPDGGLHVDEDVLRRTLELLPAGHPPQHALLGALTAGTEPGALRAWLEAAHVARPGPVLDAAEDPVGLAASMREAARPSELARRLARRSVEAVAVAGAYGAEDAARRWLDELRHVELDITGEDLLAAGIAAGPELGRRLEAARAARLDGAAPTRDEQLAAALRAG